MKKRILSFVLATFILVSSMVTQMSFTSSAASKTGIGMAEWALRAYNENWKYVYGGASVGKVDCSGLISSYAGGYHSSSKMLANNASKQGSPKSLPRIHGLILFAAPTASSSIAHTGVYVGKDENGNDMAVDARSSSIGVVYKTVGSRKNKPWTVWFKHSNLSYPTTGWYTFNGKKYYYENGEFVVGKHTVDGVTYDFGKSGALKGEVSGTTNNNSTTTTTTKKKSDVLKYGSKGDDVKKLQTRLIELGYLKGSADGSYGNKTVEAVKNFQKQVGITADGIAGKTTLSKLYSSSAPKATTTTTTTTKKTTTTTKKATTTTTKKAVTTKKTTTTTTAKKTTTTTKATQQTTTTAANGKYQELKKGDKGDLVCQLQYRLTDLGYLNTAYDGTYGEVTEKAVKAFQKKSGLKEDGIATAETQQALFASNAPKSSDPDRKADESVDANGFQILRIGDEGDAVTMLQERLAELGYFDQEITGYFGNFTFDAVVSFQVNQNLLADGIVGEETFNKIYNDDTVKAPEGYLNHSLTTDDADENAEGEDYLGKTITIDYNGETYIINEAINSLIENSVFL